MDAFNAQAPPCAQNASMDSITIIMFAYLAQATISRESETANLAAKA
jgi:hypothetical protein